MSNFLNSYETVDSRIHRFHELHPNGRIATQAEYYEADKRWVVRTEIYRDIADVVPAATGYAEEVIGSSPVNKTSALENCETSSIGRALANLGLSPKGSRPSAEEMGKAERVATPSVDPLPPAQPPKQVKTKGGAVVDMTGAPEPLAGKQMLDKVVLQVERFAIEVKVPKSPRFTLGLLSLYFGQEVKDIHHLTIGQAMDFVAEAMGGWKTLKPKYEQFIETKKAGK